MTWGVTIQPPKGHVKSHIKISRDLHDIQIALGGYCCAGNKPAHRYEIQIAHPR